MVDASQFTPRRSAPARRCSSLSNEANSLVPLGNTQYFVNSGTTTNGNQGGSSIRNITIIGDRLSTAGQTGIGFYGKTTFAYIDNIVIDYRGDPAASVHTPGSNVSNVTARNVELVNPVIGCPALQVTGDKTTDTTSIDVQGAIIGGGTIDQGRGLR